MSIKSALLALKVGTGLLDKIRDSIGHEEYDKIMSEPVKSCKCGFIKEGDYTICPKCEDSEVEV